MNTAPTAFIDYKKASSPPLLHQIRKGYLLCKPFPQIQQLIASFIQEEEKKSPDPDPNGVVEEEEEEVVRELERRLHKLYETTVGHVDEAHQPPIQYRLQYAHHIIKQLESGGFMKSGERDKEAEEESLALWYGVLEVLGKEGGRRTEPFYRWYEVPVKDGSIAWVKIYEAEGAFVSEGTTGLVVWEASIHLGDWLFSGNGERELVRRKWALELGSGCGLLGIRVLKMFPHLSKYIASDGSSSAVSKCKINFEENFGPEKRDVFQVENIDWQRDGAKFEHLVRTFTQTEGGGVLLGADIVFDPALIPPLVHLIELFLKCHQDSISFIASTVRNEETFQELKSFLGLRKGLRFRQVYDWNEHKGLVLEIKYSLE